MIWLVLYAFIGLLLFSAIGKSSTVPPGKAWIYFVVMVAACLICIICWPILMWYSLTRAVRALRKEDVNRLGDDW